MLSYSLNWSNFYRANQVDILKNTPYLRAQAKLSTLRSQICSSVKVPLNPLSMIYVPNSTSYKHDLLFQVESCARSRMAVRFLFSPNQESSFFALLLWGLWNQSNKVILQGLKQSPSETFFCATKFVEEYGAIHSMDNQSVQPDPRHKYLNIDKGKRPLCNLCRLDSKIRTY
ncbi:hypothetical protein M9H77_30390 [Catharanthus roseus]|uniref:Uncharacterized protein n=1 Tax=Catharanthus roseus TaxID=4058 RepID=A0ACB9ZX32_CATRO|nr:hypothetical protein M9H77_30390 [Catharanthus roseus]